MTPSSRRFGLPEGLRGREIRIEAQVFAVCDSFAEMRAPRPYRDGLSEDEACAQLIVSRGSQLSADAVDLFIDLLGRGLVGHLGHPDHGERDLERLRVLNTLGYGQALVSSQTATAR